MGAMKAPQPGQLMVQAVVPVLRKVIGDANDEESPPERHPVENISRSRKQKGQHLQTEISEEWPHDEPGKCKTGNIGDLLVPTPAVVVVEAEQKFGQPQHRHETGNPPIIPPAQPKALIGGKGVMPRMLTAQRDCQKQQRNRQRIDEQAERNPFEDTFANRSINLHSSSPLLK